MPLELSTLTSQQQVTALFIGYFDRAPAVNGYDFFVADLDDRGRSLSDVAMTFVDQTETEALYPGIMSTADRSPAENRAFVEDVFQNLFGRDPSFDEDGNNFWVNQLNEGANAGRLILEIMGGASETDEAVLRNKISVGESYVAAAREAGTLTRAEAGDTILDDVTDDAATVAAAEEAIAAAFETSSIVVPSNTISLNGSATIPGTDGNDIFEAESGDLTSSVRIDGGAGVDAISVFNETTGIAMSPRTENVEQFYMTNQANDLNSVADNNVGGYSTVGQTIDQTTNVDVEVDGGRMVGINRWEDYDSRADLVIEDARDDTPEDGTFTALQTVSMVSTDPGNVDFAVYFDDPSNTSTDSGTLTVRLLDLDSASQGEGPLNDNPYDQVRFTIDGEIQTLTIDALDAANVSYAAYVAALQASADAQDIPVTITLGNQFTLVQADGNPEVGTDILITVEDGTIGEDGFNASSGLPANNNTVTRQIVDNSTTEALISLNVEFDDVGKGSTGGDALFGAMSTGRQTGDDGTSDSIGIQQFDIKVDRGSILQTINSTNNALQVVNISNGENSGINNTTNAFDEMIGDLAVRGQANPGVVYADDAILDDAATPVDESLGDFGVTNAAGLALVGNAPSTVATDGAMPGGFTEHNEFGFSDVRVINASAMTGVVDITAELTEEIVEKYLDIQDSGSNGETDDIDFAYTLGNNNDEFTLNLSDDALNSAGTGSREDFDMTISGGNGNDVITTNVGDAVKLIDEQGEDHYVFASTNGEGWYTNAVSNVAAEMSVSGGAGVDTIWTHGWGDFTIDGGADADVIYTDNSGAAEMSQLLAANIDRNLTEHDQIDYVVGGVWAFNGENIATNANGEWGMTGATNDTIILGTVTGASSTSPFTATSGNAVFTVSYGGASGAAGTSYNIPVTIPFSELNVNSTTGVVTTSEQALNQAIKAGINGNQVLGNLLEAMDGPGNSLVVATKTDGEHVFGDLSVGYTSLTINNNAPLTTVGETFSGNAGYTTTAANFVNLGNTSTAESDNTIRSGSDGADDVFVLSTNDAAVTPATVNGTLTATDLNGASNETIEFDNGFGRDTVMNFDFGDNAAGDTTGEDVLDFDLLFADGSFAASSLVQGAITAATTNGEVTVAVEIGGTGPTSNDTLAEIQALYAAADTTASTTVAEEVVIVYDANDNNAGAVYSVTDGTGAGDVTVAFEGTINLVGTDWTTLTLDNFA